MGSHSGQQPGKEGLGGPVLSLSVPCLLPLEYGLGVAGTGALGSLQGGGHAQLPLAVLGFSALPVLRDHFQSQT